MHLVCDRRELSDALALASVVVPARATRQILTNVCLVAEPSRLEVLATDLEVGVRATCDRVDTSEPGVLLLNAAHTAGILREATGDRVEIAHQDGVTTITASGDSFRLVDSDADDFPEVPTFGDEPGLVVDRAMLKGMLRRTAFAAAAEGLRYALNGVLFELEGDRLRLVATDGKRLAVCEHPVSNLGGTRVARVISNKAVQLLLRLSAPDDEQLELRFSDNQLLARSSRAVLAAQLVQGHFPPYDDVIPKGLDKRIELETQPFQAALRRATLLTTKDSFAVRFAFSYNRLKLSSRIPGVGEGEVALEIPYEHDPIEAAFNPQYLADVVKVIDQPRFEFELKDGVHPCIVRESDSYRYVVMPIALS